MQYCGFPSGQQPRLVHFHRPFDVGLYSSWQLHPEAQDTGLPGECQPRHECHRRVFGVGLNTTFVPPGKVEDFTKAYVTMEVPQSCLVHVANVA